MGSRRAARCQHPRPRSRAAAAGLSKTELSHNPTLTASPDCAAPRSCGSPGAGFGCYADACVGGKTVIRPRRRGRRWLKENGGGCRMDGMTPVAQPWTPETE